MKKETLFRGGFYLAGLLILSFGITLSTRAGLGVSLVFIGCGGAMVVAMRVVTNPSDAMYVSMAHRFRKDPGLMKNVQDAMCVLGAVAFDLTLTGRISSVGLGTVATMLLTGRLVYLFNRVCRRPITRLAGLSD